MTPGPLRFLVSLLALAAAASAGGEAAGLSPLVELDVQSLTEALTRSPVLLLLHTRWCALCTAYLPEVERVAQAFSDAGAELLFGSLDVDEHPQAAKALSAPDVPFLTLLRPGEWLEAAAEEGGPRSPRPAQRYPGALAAQPTAAWLSEQTGLRVSLAPAVEEMDEAALQRALSDDDRDLLLQFYGASCGRCRDFEAEYERVGLELGRAGPRSTRVARVDVHAARALIARYNVSGLPSFRLFPAGAGGASLPFPGPRSAAALLAFARSPGGAAMEAAARARGAACEAELAGRGPGSGLSAPPGLRAQHLLSAAHGAAARGRWAEALETLLCVAHSAVLRRTAAAGSPGFWNLLDTARLQFDGAALRGAGAGAGEEEEGAWGAVWAGEQLRADDPWDRFEAVQAERADPICSTQSTCEYE